MFKSTTTANETVGQKQFVSRKGWIIHQRSDTGERPYSYLTCGKIFIDSSTLMKHQVIHQAVRPFTCRMCGHGFNQKVALQRHEKTHSQVQEFGCRFCPKTFLGKCSLQAHEKLHSGVKPFQCQYCSGAFHTVTALKQHMRVQHMIDQPPTCLHCKKTFSNNDVLLEHMETHTTSANLQCPVCPMSFNMRITLRRHIRVHVSRGNVRFCNLCQLVFHSKQETIVHFDKHMKVTTKNLGGRDVGDCGTPIKEPEGRRFSIVDLEEDGYSTREKDEVDEINNEDDVIFGKDFKREVRDVGDCGTPIKELEGSRFSIVDLDEDEYNTRENVDEINDEDDVIFGKDCKREVPRDVVEDLREKGLQMGNNFEDNQIRSTYRMKIPHETLNDLEKSDNNTASNVEENIIISDCETNDNVDSSKDCMTKVSSTKNAVKCSYRTGCNCGNNVGLDDSRGPKPDVLGAENSSKELDNSVDENHSINNLIHNIVKKQDNGSLKNSNYIIKVKKNNNSSNKEEVNCNSIKYDVYYVVERHENGDQSVCDVEGVEEHGLEGENSEESCNYSTFKDGIEQGSKQGAMEGAANGVRVGEIGHEIMETTNGAISQNSNYRQNDMGFSSLEALCNVAISAAKVLQQESTGSERCENSPKSSPIPRLNGVKFFCKSCSSTYSSTVDFRKHRCSLSSVKNRFTSVVASSKSFICDECNKIFRSKNGLQIHQRSHTGERPFACRWCDKAFRDSGTRHKHERIHTDERPYQCNQCPRAFNQSGALRAHQVTHSNCFTRSHTCKLCPSSFAYFSNLRQHIIVCHKEYNALPCPLCTSPETLHYDTSSLHEHVKTVHWTPGDEMKCSICDQNKFGNVSDFCSHVFGHVKSGRRGVVRAKCG